MNTLVIRLAAPLQSYGNETFFNRRTSFAYPSKSAVIGLLASSLGYHRDDSRIISLNEIEFAVRADQPGSILTDFHMAHFLDHGEYGKKGSTLTYRDYLQDAVFVIAIGVTDKDHLNQLVSAVRHPQFAPYLGRRSNPPAGPLIAETFTNQTPLEVLKMLPWKASDWYKQRNKREATIRLSVVADLNLFTDNRHSSFTAKDTVKSFSEASRKHGFRIVGETSIEVKNDCFTKASADTSHDVFKAI